MGKPFSDTKSDNMSDCFHARRVECRLTGFEFTQCVKGIGLDDDQI